MAEENHVSSSQESLLLSQDTFQLLWDDIMQDYGGIQNDDYKISVEPDDTSNNGLMLETSVKVDYTVPESSQRYVNFSRQNESNCREITHSENSTLPVAETSMPPANLHYVPSSLPASQDWPGDLDFSVLFEHQEKRTKAVSWTFSTLKTKLYVGKDVPCPVRFSINTKAQNMSIRTMALFTSPEHSSDLVQRCVNHSMDEINKGVFEAKHLIRCESAGAIYDVDNITERHSVVVPFENPPVGQIFSSYIYKFVCFGSCNGGPNRRPLMLIFTLEKDGQVVGRRRIDLKICACPGRDRKIEESQESHSLNRITTAKRTDIVNLSDALENTKSVSFPLSKRRRTEPNSNGEYTVQATDAECYHFLKQMKRFYEICETMKHLSPDLKTALLQRRRTNPDSDTS